MSSSEHDHQHDGQIINNDSEVIYQIYPSSFNDANGDGHGDLQGIIQRLDYLSYLGVDAIWISPFYPSPEGPEGDGGYAVTNRRDIDPRFGDLDDFKELLDEAHSRNLRVYIDDVLPHTSDEHEWFEASCRRESPYEDFYVWHDGVEDENGDLQPPNNWLSVFGGGAWEWNDTREQFYFHHYLTSQPALNLNKTEVQDAVLDDMKFWLDMGVDGFRYDSLPYANYDPELRDNSWMDDKTEEGWEDQYFDHSHVQPQTLDLVKRIRDLADSYPDKKTTLGEVICGREGGRNPMPVAAEYTDPETGLDMCYTDMFRAIAQDTGHGYVQGVIKNMIKLFPNGGHCNALGNHDSPRIASRDMEGVSEAYKQKALRQLFKIMAALPGSLSIYQGDELALTDARIPDDIREDQLKDPVAKTKGVEHCRDGVRTPMPWHSGRKNADFSVADETYLPVPDAHYHKAVNKQIQDPASMLNFTRSLIQWRKNQPALLNGQTILLDTQEPILAFLRRSEEQDLLCVFNMSGSATMLKPSDLLDEETLERLSISKDEVMSIPPYESDFRGGHVYMQSYCPQPKRRLDL